MAICLILHDINLAAQYADYPVLLKEGQIMAQGMAAFTVENIETVFEFPMQAQKLNNRPFFVYGTGNKTQ